MDSLQIESSKSKNQAEIDKGEINIGGKLLLLTLKIANQILRLIGKSQWINRAQIAYHNETESSELMCAARTTSYAWDP